MGIRNPFSSKVKYATATSVTRVIEDKLLPDTTKTAILRGIFNKEDSLSDVLVESMSHSVGSRMEQMYRWSKDKYTYGLPQATLMHNNSDAGTINGVLNQVAGRPVEIEYSHYGALNNLHYGWQQLVDQYGYDQESNEITSLSALKGFPVYLVDMVEGIPANIVDLLEVGALEQWGTPPSSGYTPRRPAQVNLNGLNIGNLRTRAPFIVDPAASAIYLRVTYCWVRVWTELAGQVLLEKREYHEESVNVPITFSLEEQNNAYFQVMYSYQLIRPGEPQWAGHEPPPIVHTVYRYFTYKDRTGTYPELDVIYDARYDGSGTYFPRVYFRLGRHDTSADTSTEAYRDSKKMLKILGIDFNGVAKAINENPDIGDVEQAFMVAAVPANTVNELEQRYLFDYFKWVYLTTGGVGTSPAAVIGPALSPQAPVLANIPQTTLILKDAVFESSINFRSISRRIVAGSLTEGRTYFSERTVQTITSMGVTSGMSEMGDPVYTPYEYVEEVHVHKFCHQRSPGLYEEIQVVGLGTRYNIDPLGGLDTNTPPDSPDLIIPLDYSIAKGYSNQDRETLYARSLHFVFNSVHEYKIKWYAQGWFKAVLIIVAIIMIYYMDFTDAALILSLLEMGAYMVVVILILVAVVEMAIMALFFKWLARTIGPSAALILALVLTVVSVGASLGAEGGLASAPWATTLLKVASGLTKGAGEAVSTEMKDLLKEGQDFSKEAEKQMALLEDAQELLDGQNILSPFTIFGEKPEDFYNRTTHSGNIGVLAFDALHSYVDIALTLPKFSDTPFGVYVG